MPTPPSDVWVWDAAKTNYVRPTSGHLASGFANSEIPTSAEFNASLWMMSSWCQYIHDVFAAHFTPAWRWETPGQVYNSGSANGRDQNFGVGGYNSAPDCYIQVAPVPVGTQINAAKIMFTGSGGAITVDFYLYVMNATVSTLWGSVAVSSPANTPSEYSLTVAGGMLNYALVDGDTLIVKMHSPFNATNLNQIGLQLTPAT